MEAMEGRAVVGTMKYTWRALERRFGDKRPSDVTAAECLLHTNERQAAGIMDGTIHTELGHLRTVLLWAAKKGHITAAPHIERPPKPPPKEAHLTKAECARLMRAAAEQPHLRLYVILALTTGARTGAILDLTWDRVDFKRKRIDLRNPEITVPHKGRAIVPMNATLEKALVHAKPGSASRYVIEYGSQQIGSVKRSLATAAEVAGLGKVSPHMLRHSAAVHMAEEGIGMEEIAQFLGHSNLKMTRQVYARFSPDYLHEAAAALEYDLDEDPN